MKKRFLQSGIKGTLVLIGAIGAASACKIFQQESEKKTVAIESSKRWQKAMLDVCWESDTDVMTEWKAGVRDHIVANFNKTKIRLVGWETCENDYTGDIRVFIYDSVATHTDARLGQLREALLGEEMQGHPRVRFWGTELKGRWAGLVLTSRFTQVHPGLVEQARKFSKKGKWNLIRGISLHEMGHAVGLAHEDAHPDRTCDDFAQDLMGDVPVSPYNYESAMSRCFYRNKDYEADTLYLNQGDIDGLNRAYDHLP